ncbi:MAG: glycosyl hydrolase [Lentisphaerae bacterium GWF2_52_8]|nr:MAG: glycosyl hydrolase [Lentisphaerae bacterium GWF2_52_8]
MIKIDPALGIKNLEPKLSRFWKLSGEKILALADSWGTRRDAPVFTVRGKYASRGWTEWTQGFQFGSPLLQFDASGERRFLDYGRDNTLKLMSPHLTHFGVHDHGFNNVSTYGNLLRLASEGKFEADAWEKEYYKLALKCSGAVQAHRWTALPDGGYIHSFNGPHSLFADTIRSLRALALAEQLGHLLMAENDQRISLLSRLVSHARCTAKFAVYYGEGRDAYDVCGRVAHESIFNGSDGNYRCPNSQQGYSPFSTWTRGLAWILCGFSEQLEFIETLSDELLLPCGGRKEIESFMLKAAIATADFYLRETPADGIPYWDTGAPGLAKLGNYLDRAADPFNPCEPVDSSAAAIAAQGLLRLAHYLEQKDGTKSALRYRQAGLAVADTLLGDRYLSLNSEHEGLLLHSVYHRPNNWDYIPPGTEIPCGESSMWGDYHIRELALYLSRELRGEPCLRFFLKNTGEEKI